MTYVTYTIPVFDRAGNQRFYICAPTGRMRASHGFDMDPRKVTFNNGDPVLRPMQLGQGLDGIRFSYFQCAGGDVVRFVQLPAGDRRAELFGGAEWWEVLETVEEHLACSSSLAH